VSVRVEGREEEEEEDGGLLAYAKAPFEGVLA